MNTIDYFKQKLKFENPNPEQVDMYKKIGSLMKKYQENNSFENREFLCYLSATIFLLYKNKFPQLSIHISFRTKGDQSFIVNINNEFNEFMTDLNITSEWNTFETLKDLSGMRIVLNDINNSIPPTPEFEELMNDIDVKKAVNNSNHNSKIIKEVNNFINSSIKTKKDFMQLKYKLLKTLDNITPNEFTKERKLEPSFKELFNQYKIEYKYYIEHQESFNINASTSEINELKNFLQNLYLRQNDELQTIIINKTLPMILNDSIITNALQTSYKFDKHPYKPNGFTARYDNLKTPFGNIELQSQSSKAYYAQTKGSAYHSGVLGKNIDIEEYFELVDPNDKHSLSYYLESLDSISADSLISPYELPKFKTKQEKLVFFKTPKGIAYKNSEKYRNLLKHIKIKDTMEVLPAVLPKKVYYKEGNVITNRINQKKLQECIKTGEIKLKTVNTNDYLLSTALSLSPYMNICSAGHTSYTTASIHHKKIIGEFAEVLRKKDCNTCLRDLLIRRVEDLIETYRPFFNNIDSLEVSNSIKTSLKIVKKHDDIANSLPKDLSFKNIASYAEKLRNFTNNRKQKEEDFLEY